MNFSWIVDLNYFYNDKERNYLILIHSLLVSIFVMNKYFVSLFIIYTDLQAGT